MATPAFSPTSRAKTELADGPHRDHQLPPPHAFAHQLNPPPSFASSNTPQISRRSSRDLRHHPSNGAMAGANGNGNGIAVPGGRMRDMGFGGARSPPSNKSRQKR